MMNFEKPFEKKQNIESQIEKAEKIVNEIISQLKNNPQYKEIANQKAEKIEEKWKQLKASAKNERSSNQIQEFINKGLATELFKTEEFDPHSEDVYNSNRSNGYRTVSSPVYGNDDNEIISHRYYLTPENPTAEQIDIADKINKKYEEEGDKSFYNSCKLKESLFDEKIASGEMVFLGEMSVDDFADMFKNIPEAHKVKYEYFPVFEENQIDWLKTSKWYAYTGVEIENNEEKQV